MVFKYYLQRSLLNNIHNLLLQARAWIYSKTNLEIRQSLPPSNYELVYSDSFESETLSEDWRVGQPWGFFHPQQPYWYWTDESIQTTTSGLILENRYIPLTVYKKDLPDWLQQNDLPAEFVIPWASGLISSKKSFKFGWIEAEIMLPKEEMQWSAFWTSGVSTWPPEIDIFEAYTDQDVENIKIQPNIHWGDTSSKKAKKMYGAPTIPVKDPSNRFVKYAVHWTDKFIKFYYDGILVQVCNNHQMLSDNAADQFIIINNGLQSPTEKHQPTEGKMVVKNLKVFQKKS